jgi:hypothetical protein
VRDYLSLNAEYFIPGHGPVGGKGDVTKMLDYLTNVRNVMKELIADGKSEEEAIRAGGEIEYCLSGGGHPHISTLKKWHRIWRTRVSI